MVLAARPKRQPTIHDKKRQGSHHRPSKHYTKIYWPYLPLLLLVGLGFAFNTLWNNHARVLGARTDISQSNLLQLSNIERTSHNDNALTLNDQLAHAAQAKADDMAQRNYWSHLTPDGKQPWQFAQASGYQYTAFGENLAYGFSDSESTVRAWMSSAKHRTNLLDASYTDVGFGIASAANFRGDGTQTIVVAMYGQPDLAAQARNTARSPHYTAVTNASSDSATSAPLNQPASIAAAARSVTRLEALSIPHTSWVVVAIAAVSGICVIVFAVRHALLWKRVLIRGEEFFKHHHGVDLMLVAAGIVGFLLTRTSGFIY